MEATQWGIYTHLTKTKGDRAKENTDRTRALDRLSKERTGNKIRNLKKKERQKLSRDKHSDRGEGGGGGWVGRRERSCETTYVLTVKSMRLYLHSELV